MASLIFHFRFDDIREWDVNVVVASWENKKKTHLSRGAGRTTGLFIINLIYDFGAKSNLNKLISCFGFAFGFFFNLIAFSFFTPFNSSTLRRVLFLPVYKTLRINGNVYWPIIFYCLFYLLTG